MKYAIALIDKAGKNVGSFYKLYQITGIPQSRISEIRAGKRPLPLDAVPVIAELAGVDVDEAIHTVMIEQTKDPEKRGRLMEILGKAVAAGVAGVLAFSYSGDSISSTVAQAQKAENVNPLYIVEYVTRMIVAARSYLTTIQNLRMVAQAMGTR